MSCNNKVHPRQCDSYHKIQNPSKTPLDCPRIASNALDVYLYHSDKNKRSTAP